jgi:hypothetical protein
MASKLIATLAVATISFVMIGCQGQATDDMKVDAPTMSADEQAKVEGGRHDEATQQRLDSRPR